ncbi:MAG: hypothetical protein HYX67_09420 [Candidatus Melainabacteria bacterium]|nr:hypothetical protein [Candidatus Melainabacteria bacterium]
MIGGKFNLTQKGLLLVAIPLVLELVFFGSLIYLLNETERQRNEAEHARQLIGHTNAVIVMVYNALSELAPASLGATEVVTEDEEFQGKLKAIHQEYESLLALADGDYSVNILSKDWTLSTPTVEKSPWVRRYQMWCLAQTKSQIWM